MENSFRILLIGDVHYDPTGEDGPDGMFTRGPELVHAAIADARGRADVHAVAVMGDLLHDGTVPEADEWLGALREAAASAIGDAELLVVPGNHDGDGQRLLDAFGVSAGGRQVAGCRLFVFADAWWADDTGHRPPGQQRQFLEWASAGDGRIVALQHNPIHPPIESDYPYVLAEADQVAADYAAVGVVLSVSAHYHPGLPLSFRDGVGYLTCPALHKPPHHYAEVTLRGREVRVTLHRLLAS
jgi:3',5'-cyclic AMP phosphodiesterase CpdA